MLEITHRSSVTPDQIDHLGHMNVRFYGVNAHAATRSVLAGVTGWPAGPYLVHDSYTRHFKEQMLGTALVVRSAFLGAGAGGLVLHHELAPADAEAYAATFVHRVSPIDDSGKRLPVPAAAIRSVTPSIVAPRPYAAPRTINLGHDLLAGAPALPLLLERRLDVRRPRPVSPDECSEDGLFRPDAMFSLLWGGERPDHAEDWLPDLYEGPAGELMGWAVMETRVQLARLFPAGTNIQSFSAHVAVHERATHRVSWVYDLDEGDLLCAFESVDVAFDTRRRRTMAIPEVFRRRYQESLQPDLAPPPA